MQMLDLESTQSYKNKMGDRIAKLVNEMSERPSV